MKFRFLNQLFDFVLPRLCATCQTKLKLSEEIICSICNQKIETASEQKILHEFNRKFKEDKLITDFASAFIFKDGHELQQLIHSLKYDKNYHIGKFLGKVVANNLFKKIQSWQADLIIPIPLHSLRKAERGFNQANEISKGLAKYIKLPNNSKVISRIRFTETQTKLSLSERKTNIEGAFSIRNKKMIKNKNIILVDDVITTGATTSECANLLLKNGANKIYAVSVGIAE
ncbi:MAG: ComF family protein [Ignavibacteriales bacterium]|nr:ComF family protein [Ignavibacteriales bacterium]